MKSQTLLICAVALLAVPMLAFAAMGKDAQGTDGLRSLKSTGPIGTAISGNSTTGSARLSGADSCGRTGCDYWAKLTKRGTGYKLTQKSSQSACCNACWKDNRCYAWSWGFTGNRKNQCYFFNQADEATAWYDTRYYNSGLGYCGDQ